VLPDWYQSAFHSEAYVLQHYARYFDVLAYIPGGMNDVQDAVLLQRRASDDPMLDQEIAMYAGVRQLHSHISTLENLLEIKNAHISQIEHKITQFESGRVMRLLRMIA
jgi:hypothetical protein